MKKQQYLDLNNQKDVKRYIRSLLKGYTKMTREIEKGLEFLGIEAEHHKKHWKLTYNGYTFSCPSTASDYRAGMNLATELCKVI